MATNRLNIRKSMLDEDWHEGLYGTATAGSATTLTDATLLAVGGNASSRFGTAHLYRPAAATAGDVYRRLTATGYAPTTGALTHGTPNYSVAPLASGDSGYYEIWPWDPRLVNSAINRALTTRCFSLQRDLVVTDGSSRYDVTQDPFSLTVTNIQDQIVDISQVTGTDPNAIVTPWDTAGKTWWPESDNGTLYIRFSPAPTGTLQVTWKKPYAALANDSTSSDVPEDYAKWAAYYELFIALEKQAKRRGETDSIYAGLKADAYERYWTENHKYLDRFAAQFKQSRPRWRSSASAPRMGRGSTSLHGAGSRTITGT